MKKLLFLVISALIIGAIGYRSPVSACSAMEVEQGLCNENTSSSTSTSNTDPNAAAAAAKKACQSTATTDSCSKSYSCDSLFTDHATANKCNYDRCLKERGGASDADGYCNCKYGNNGDGKSVGIPLNTSIPFVGKCSGRASNTTDSALSAFPSIIQAASRILVTVILLFGFIMIVVGGVQRASGDAKSGKEKIKKVAIGFALLGMMGAILRLINPNFFK